MFEEWKFTIIRRSYNEVAFKLAHMSQKYSCLAIIETELVHFLNCCFGLCSLQSLFPTNFLNPFVISRKWKKKRVLPVKRCVQTNANINHAHLNCYSALCITSWSSGSWYVTLHLVEIHGKSGDMPFILIISAITKLLRDGYWNLQTIEN